jgi:hypothetical protein
MVDFQNNKNIFFHYIQQLVFQLPLKFTMITPLNNVFTLFHDLFYAQRTLVNF